MAPSNSIGVAARSAAFKYRCIHGASAVRQYSSRTIFSPNARVSRPTPSSSPYLYNQSRSISLFGWGSSSSSPSVSVTNSPSNSSDITLTDPPSWQSSSNILESGRTFKASHGTADTPASSFESHKPSALEPQPIEDLQRAITDPYGLLSETDLSKLPERLGYLREDCGLDFGWGPSTTMQWIFEHIHMDFGLSWTASAIVLGLAFRFAILPFSITAAHETVKMRELKPARDGLMAQHAEARAERDMQKMQQVAMEMRYLNKSYGVKTWKAMLPLFVQIPFGFGAWRMLRNAASLPVPAWVTENWLWTHDLTLSDPYFLAPALSAGIIYFTLKSNQKANAGMANSSFQQLLVKAMPALTFVFMVWQPGAVQVYFVASSIAGLLTTYLMANTHFRAIFNLAPLVPVQPVRPSSGPGFINIQGRTINSSSSSTGPMRRRDVPPAPEPTSTQTPPSNRSWIDKSLDSAKSSWQNSIKTPYQNMMKDSFEKSGRAKANKKEKETFERERREARERLRQEEWRKERNEEERRRARGK